MNQPILNMFQCSGDAHIGQTIERLARLAEVMHQYQTAMAIKDECSADDLRIDAIDPQPVDASEHVQTRSAYREVRR